MENIKLREKIGYGLGDAASSMFGSYSQCICYSSTQTW